MKRSVKRDVQKNRRSTTQDIAEASGLCKYAVKTLLKDLGCAKKIA